MSSSAGVQRFALQVPEPCVVLHFSFQLGGQYRGAGRHGPCIPRAAVSRSVGGVRVRAGSRPEDGSRRPSEGVAEKRSVFVFLRARGLYCGRCGGTGPPACLARPQWSRRAGPGDEAGAETSAGAAAWGGDVHLGLDLFCRGSHRKKQHQQRGATTGSRLEAACIPARVWLG